MRIADLRELTVPLSGAVANAVVSFSDHTVSLVALISDQVRNGKAVVGFGFNSIGRYGQAGILNERMFPRIRAADPDSLISADGTSFDAAAIAASAMRNEKPGGHGDRAGALGALELAVWDLNAKLADEPACNTIARHFNLQPIPAVPVYAAGGYYYPQDSGRSLKREIEDYQALGFNAFKMKIGGATLSEDLRRIETALDVAGDGSRLAVDANGKFDLAQALEFGRVIAPFGLRWYEEAGDPLDYALNQELAMSYSGTLATGENLFSASDTRNLLRFGGMRPNRDIFQMDPGLSYGLTEYVRILDLLETDGFDRAQCFPHGGHLINLHIASGLGLGGCEAYPGVFQPFGGYPSECEVSDGLVRTTHAPGFGLEQKRELTPYLTTLATTA